MKKLFRENYQVLFWKPKKKTFKKMVKHCFRYISVCKPLQHIQRNPKVRWIALPIYLFGTIFNIPRFCEWRIDWEWKHWCTSPIVSNGTSSQDLFFLSDEVNIKLNKVLKKWASEKAQMVEQALCKNYTKGPEFN